MARRKGLKSSDILRPGDIALPGVAKDPGVRARFNPLQVPRRIDPRGAALGDLAQAKGGLADATRGLANTTRQSGTIAANALAQVGQAQSQVADATLKGGQIVANAQEMFANSVAQIGQAFETLGNLRKKKEEDLAVEKWEFNRAKATIGFEQSEAENPNPKRLRGKAYLDDVDSRYAKFLDDNTKATEEELGFTIAGEARAKVTALSLRARVQAMESAANRDHDRSVMQLYETAKNDVIESGRLVGADGDIGTGLARADKISSRIEGVVAPDKYLGFKEAARRNAYEQGIRHYLAKGDVATAEAIVSQLTGLPGPGADSVSTAIMDAFRAEGVDTVLGLAISHRETAGTFDPQSKTFIDPRTGKRASSASGLFHMTDATAKSYLGAVNASDDPVENQVKAGAKLTADNKKGLQRILGREPSYGEVYLAHVLGLNKAAAVVTADPDVPLSTVLNETEIRNSAPKLLRGSVGDMRAWADDAMQASMEAVTNAGIVTGRTIASNEAGLPMDDAARLWKEVEDTKKRLADEQEKLNNEFIDAFVPVKPRAERDSAAFVIKYSPVAAKAYGVADAVKADPESTREEKIAAQTRAFAVSIEEQKMLAGARGVSFSERDAKLLSIPQAKAIVNSLTEAKGPDAVQAFYQLRDETGSYFTKVYGELVDQKLPAEFQILGLLDPVQNPAQVNSMTQILGVSTETLKKDLGAAGQTVDADLFNPIEESLTDFRQAWEFGPYGESAKQQASSLIEAAKKVGLNHYRLTGDLSEAQRRAVALIEDNVEIVVGDNIRAIVPKETGLSETEIEAATEFMQKRSRIDEFEPESIGVPTATRPGTPESFGMAAVYNEKKDKADRRMLEFWDAGDEGWDWEGKHYDRPANLPLDKAGIEVLDKSASALDVLGDIVSHKLVKTDQTLANIYSTFKDSLTPYQDWRFHKIYDKVRAKGEEKSFEEWLDTNGLPELFRGYTFRQYDTEDMKGARYTPEQKKLLDGVFNYLGVNPDELKAQSAQSFIEQGNVEGNFRKDRTRQTAANYGIWATNDRGDGLTLLVPMGNGVSFTRLFNAKGEPYEIKFADIPVLAKKGAAERVTKELEALPSIARPELP